MADFDFDLKEEESPDFHEEDPNLFINIKNYSEVGEIIISNEREYLLVTSDFMPLVDHNYEEMYNISGDARRYMHSLIMENEPTKYISGESE